MSCTIFSCAVMASDDFFPVAEPVCVRASQGHSLGMEENLTVPSRKTPPLPGPSPPAIHPGVLGLLT